jgi:hypothetical protein
MPTLKVFLNTLYILLFLKVKTVPLLVLDCVSNVFSLYDKNKPSDRIVSTCIYSWIKHGHEQ